MILTAYLTVAGITAILGFMYFMISIYEWHYYDTDGYAWKRRAGARNAAMALSAVLLSVAWPLVLVGLAVFFWKQSAPPPTVVKNGAEYR